MTQDAMPKLLNYEEWLELNPDILLQEVECEECNGDGSVICFHCGQDMDCEYCGGTGKKNDAHSIYEEQVGRDMKTWSKYIASISK